MVLLLLVGLLVALGMLALRFGHDSREVMQSKEAELASFGMEWPAPAMPVQVRPVTRRRRVRRAVARRLYALAEWLNPGTRASVRPLRS